MNHERGEPRLSGVSQRKKEVVWKERGEAIGDFNRDNFSGEPGVWARCQNGRHAVRKEEMEGVEVEA